MRYSRATSRLEDGRKGVKQCQIRSRDPTNGTLTFEAMLIDEVSLVDTWVMLILEEEPEVGS